MNKLIYVGRFYPWTDKHEDELFDALNIFDEVIIAVTKLSKKKPLKGQPSKLLDKKLLKRVKIIYFNKLEPLLAAKKDYKYIMFERR